MRAISFRIPGSAVLWLAVCMLAGSFANATTIDPSDPDILYTGRWDHTVASAPWAQQKGSSIIVNFQGSSFGVTMATAPDDTFRIIVDGDVANSTKIAIPSAVPTVLVSGLADGDHSIEIHKENDKGRATLTALEIDPLKSTLPPPARPARRIVFYGDSNVAGFSLESERNQGAASLQGSYYTYAGVTARMFDAEYMNISRSGATIGTLLAAYKGTDWDNPVPPWDFSRFPADVVLVNIGANDIYASTRETIKASYHVLLDNIRADHPDSHIVLFNAFGWDFAEPATYTHEVVAERQDMGDDNISVTVFPWVFNQFHGCETDHSGMAHYLARHLESVMGWTAGPADVMNGYGMDGHLANGSFEHIAPFGGWGWRYRDDPNVSRIHDPATAPDGEYYLRLADGATNQQTNPASNGQAIDINLMMRGAVEGAEAKITINFRAQNQGASPTAGSLASHTQSFTLTDTWQPYNMQVSAPSAPPSPVFAYRVILEAGAGHTVDFDMVAAADFDSDGIADNNDNCTEVVNADQRDVDNDGIGSLCDPDLSNNCIVNFVDLGQLKSVFLSTDPNADLNNSGAVNFGDVGIMKSMFLQPPGPSGVPNICDD